MANARHSKAGRFVQQRLFAGLSTFVELERRIADLPDEKSRGDAFEVFAEAYLATQRKHDAETVWPLPSAPTDILGNLQLAMKDYGVDGVLRTRLGKFSAYQVKFRTSRPALTWRELSTFMGLADSPNIHSRILLTNCDELPSVLNDRQGFFCIRGSDLDRLEPDDFKVIEAWLADSAYQAPKKTPQPHQTEALDVILPACNAHDRVSAIMACGTGKTLVALWVAERMQASRVLVLVPSLALLRQILHEWLGETNLPALAYLCVCSDPTVKEGLDAIDTKQSDLDFQVSTDAASVREFLDAPFTGVKVVFSTYQSARVVGAALKPGAAFDLAVFDEAHKTAGREGRNYAFALEDANLPIRKRLFLTATPRHYNPKKRDKEGDAQLVFSMDNPEVYGPQAFRLTFAEAARRGIICGYKVVISVITSEMVTNELLSHGEVVVNGDAVRARQVANQIALRDAIGKYGVTKVFTFHSTVKSAASFVSDGNEGIGTHLNRDGSAVLPRRPDQKKWAARQRGPTKKFQTFHVNGTMPTALREREMRNFRAAARAVISNARCLTEGVDVPAVDMVAFLSPRRSRVDIVQATGRAMRGSPGKATGYVLVPLYVELAAGETVEAAVNRAEFDEVWDVLNSLQEQDEMLAEIVRGMREQRGRTKGFDNAKFRKCVEICGPSSSLAAIRNAVTTQCIERLGSSWDERFGELRAFKTKFGHCDVSRNWRDGRGLGGWVVEQRKFKRRGILSPERIWRLESLGFIWQPLDAAWELHFSELCIYRSKHGHCGVPLRWLENPDLGRWVNALRSLKRQGRLAEDRIARLNRLGFEWNPVGSIWERRFNQLVEYKQRKGNCDVPAKWKQNPSLGKWVSHQRSYRLQAQLNAERVRRLDAIGFEWSPIDTVWEENFAALKKYREQVGDCDVPANYPKNPVLGRWVSMQRRLRKVGRLAAERTKMLSKLGIKWNHKDSAWDRFFAELLRYKKQHGNSNVPQRYTTLPGLGVWVNNQRRHKKLKNLSQERIRRLNAIGFEWGGKSLRQDRRKSAWETKWESMVAQLVAFKRESGHCNVPKRWRKNPELGKWVQRQRTCKRKRILARDRIEQLEGIGFQWRIR